MSKELMWVCAILPQELNKSLMETCRKENMEVNLPDEVFKFPLHISMKKSFYTNYFEKVKNEVIAFIHSKGDIRCCVGNVVCHKNMIWLPIEPNGEIKQWHDELDQILLNKYGIPIDKLDIEFKPHISLFTKGHEEQLLEMKQRLNHKIEPMELVLNIFVVGSSRHDDEFIEIK
jgi:hypothetical protein